MVLVFEQRQISGIGIFVTLCFKAILMLTTMEDLNLNILMSLITKTEDAKSPSTSVICCCHVHFFFITYQIWTWLHHMQCCLYLLYVRTRFMEKLLWVRLWQGYGIIMYTLYIVFCTGSFPTISCFLYILCLWNPSQS